MYRILTFQILIIFCCSFNSFAQETNIIHTKRILFGIKSHSKTQIPLQNFLTVCDSVFEKSGIAKMAIILSNEYLNGNDYLPKEYKVQIKQFKPDAFIAIFPVESKTIMNRVIVKFDAYLQVVEPIDYEFLPVSFDDTQIPSNEIFIGSITLTKFSSIERSIENGIENGHKFINTLKKYISTLR